MGPLHGARCGLYDKRQTLWSHGRHSLSCSCPILENIRSPELGPIMRAAPSERASRTGKNWTLSLPSDHPRLPCTAAHQFSCAVRTSRAGRNTHSPSPGQLCKACRHTTPSLDLLHLVLSSPRFGYRKGVCLLATLALGTDGRLTFCLRRKGPDLRIAALWAIFLPLEVPMFRIPGLACPSFL